MQSPRRNDPCPCGSGKKFKKCCGHSMLAVPPVRTDPSLHADAAESAWIERLTAMIAVGRYAAVEDEARALTVQRPDSGMSWKLLGVSLRMQGKEALPVLQRAVQLLPDDPEAHSTLGNALLEFGRADEAAACYRRALQIRPDFAEAHNNLGAALRALHRLEEALASYRRALAIRPDQYALQRNLGHVLLELGRLDEAVATYRCALALRPDAADSHNNLGNALRALGQCEEAAASCRRALELKPEFPEACNNLGNALLDLGELDEAVANYRNTLALQPDYAETHNNLGMALRLLGRTAEAEASCRRAYQLNPNLAATISLRAELLADQGRFAEAEELFGRAITMNPNSAEAWAAIPRLRRMTREDGAWLAAAQRIVGQTQPPRQEAFLRYAIGKYFNDVEDFEQAFVNFRRANELMKLYKTKYEWRQTTRAFDRIIRCYDRPWLSRARPHANTSARPVFIIGMPRSGTTLAEQILASHPSVFGAGELTFWKSASAGYDACAPDVQSSEAELGALAEDYLRLLQRLAPDALRVVDKMPANFLQLGLVHAALPNARFIHMRRNPVDTCLSIYCQHFRAVPAYANDLEDLAHYYGEYIRVMRHWQAVLADDVLLDVPYEGVVEEQEAWSRKMLEFIDLPWDPRCMEFHRTHRSVVTASNWQVRQRISRSSVGRWRNYERFVGPLLPLLAPIGH
jgi:tetratricopeptide (TPR) repeat protein